MNFFGYGYVSPQIFLRNISEIGQSELEEQKINSEWAMASKKTKTH